MTINVPAPTTCATVLRFRDDLSVIEDGAGLVLAHEDGGVRLAAPGPGVRAAIGLLTKAGASADSLAAVARQEDGEHGAAQVAYLLRRWGARGLLRSTLTVAGLSMLDAEPMVGGWWPPADTVAGTVRTRFQLSRFASLRRHREYLALESPHATVRITLHGPLAGALVAALAQPQTAEGLAEVAGQLGYALTDTDATAVLAHLVAAGFAGELDADGQLVEDTDPVLAQWEPHDLAFHMRSRRGRHDGETGATYRLAERIPPLPAVKPPMAGPRIALPVPDLALLRETGPSFTAVLEDRRSVRTYGDSPISRGQLGELLYRSARVRSVGAAPPPGCHSYQLSDRPYPSGGAVYDLEIYAAVNQCDGIDGGLYHYDAAQHELVRLADLHEPVRRLLRDAETAAALACPPQILLILASRFQRASWKYSGSAYALVLKNAGVLTQTLYLVATAMGLAPCALGNGDSELFAQAAGLDPLVETSVCELLIGRAP